jgi:hypothetical protein
LDWLIALINRGKHERDLIVTRLSIAIETARQQGVDLQAGDLKVLLTEIEHLVVAGRLHDLLLERFVQTTSRSEFGIGPIDLRVQRAELVFLIPQPGFEQIDIASARAARGGEDGKRQQSKSEPHP